MVVLCHGHVKEPYPLMAWVPKSMSLQNHSDTNMTEILLSVMLKKTAKQNNQFFYNFRAALWKQNSYVSSSVAFDSEEEEEEEDSGIDFTGEGDGDRAQSRSINYVSGDVTDPVDAKTDVNLIIHCAGIHGEKNNSVIFIQHFTN